MKARTLILALALAMVATCMAGPVKKKTATTKKTGTTEKIRVEINSKNTTIFDKACKAYENQQYVEATALFNRAITEDDRVEYAWTYLGSIKLNQEENQEAVELLSKAVGMMNDETDIAFKAWAYSELSAAELETGDLENADAHISTAVKLQPNNGHYALERAVVRFKQHDYAGAGSDARMALSLKVDEEDAERAQALANACDRVSTKADGTNVINSITPERDTIQTDEAVLPEFPGGRKAMQEFIKNNIVYPKKAYKKGIEGNVIVECNFDTEGNMQASQVLEGVNPELDAEALRVCQAMPKFSPATVKGKPIYSKLHIQVKFKINK